jgi:2-dehydro-3-deoxyphosphogluconate aldolase/(4S)-4-hydroxy-2-oxoglutarate aldolase
MSAVERIREERVVAVLRNVPDVDAVVDALVAGGIRVVEVTLDSRGALDAIGRLAARGDVTVLAGTVRRPAQVDEAVRAGAEACVGPALVSAVVERCLELGVAAVPGALTPSEVEAAWQAGAALVKLFPGSLGGPRYVRELLAPLSDVPLLVTGGVDARNAAAYLDAGAVAVGAGSSLTEAAGLELAAGTLVDAVRFAGATPPPSQPRSERGRKMGR